MEKNEEADDEDDEEERRKRNKKRKAEKRKQRKMRPLELLSLPRNTRPTANKDRLCHHAPTPPGDRHQRPSPSSTKPQPTARRGKDAERKKERRRKGERKMTVGNKKAPMKKIQYLKFYSSIYALFPQDINSATRDEAAQYYQRHTPGCPTARRSYPRFRPTSPVFRMGDCGGRLPLPPPSMQQRRDPVVRLIPPHPAVRDANEIS